MSDLPEGCIDELRAGTLPIDRDLGTLSSGNSSYSVFGFNGSECYSYSWFKFKNGSSEKLMTPHYGLNVNSSAWDCNHTALTWGLYAKVTILGGSTAPWMFVTGGNSFGNLIGGTCTYTPGNPPGGAGVTIATIPVTPAGISIEYRLGVRAWQHDDVNFGHPGTWCGGSSECNHNPLVKFSDAL
ncbi:hypothetical protein [Sorangium sp. So ce1000]|uniref:hypothetical protein n=1 Tax=Sorangium sp. So ce1000 TaxID=3133325 RepID=UPI003F5E43A1